VKSGKFGFAASTALVELKPATEHNMFLGHRSANEWRFAWDVAERRAPKADRAVHAHSSWSVISKTVCY